MRKRKEVRRTRKGAAALKRRRVKIVKRNLRRGSGDEGGPAVNLNQSLIRQTNLNRSAEGKRRKKIKRRKRRRGTYLNSYEIFSQFLS